MGDLKLQGQSGLFGKEQPVQVRKLPSAVDAKQIEGMTKGNNLDEIVVEDKLGERHIVYADELSVKDGKMPKVGDKVNLPFLDEEVKVIHVDDEVNEDRVLAGMSVGFGLAGLAVTRLAGGSTSGSDAGIKQFSQEPEVSQKEMNWAKDIQDKSLKGKNPSAADQARFNDVMKRYATQQKVENSPYQPGSKISNGDLKWALKLEKQVHKTGYSPKAEETKRYKEVFTQLNKENPVKQVPQAEIDWALKLEKKVVDQGYKPTEKEITRYQGIAKDYNDQKANSVMGLSPLPELIKSSELQEMVEHIENNPVLDLPDNCGTNPDKKASVSDAELAWANQLQQLVQQGYMPNVQEQAAYENIFTRYQNETPRAIGETPKPAAEPAQAAKPAAKPRKTD